jgi:hypothetical protein
VTRFRIARSVRWSFRERAIPIAGDPFHVALAFAAAAGLAALLFLWARGGLRQAEAAG